MARRKKSFETPKLSTHDLTEALYEATMKLNEANKELTQRERARLEFYANISHDLRAPITAILSFTEYLLARLDQAESVTEDPEELSREELTLTLTRIATRAKDMQVLVNDIFLLASLESSPEKYHPEPVDAGFFLEDYFYLCEADPVYQDARLTLDVEEDALGVVDMDPALMHRVLDNLFSNAMRYGGSPAEITLGARRENNELTIWVADKGPGIAPEQLPHIFKRAFRGDTARTPVDDSGSGFGLAIVQTIVERHGGSITCQSSLGEGTSFWIRIPARSCPMN